MSLVAHSQPKSGCTKALALVYESKAEKPIEPMGLLTQRTLKAINLCGLATTFVVICLATKRKLSKNLDPIHASKTPSTISEA